MSINSPYTHYYAIREANKINRDTAVIKIMKTAGYKFVAPGIYQHQQQPVVKFFKLASISEWDYDMLDAFGVEVITLDEFRALDGLYQCHA